MVTMMFRIDTASNKQQNNKSKSIFVIVAKSRMFIQVLYFHVGLS